MTANDRFETTRARRLDEGPMDLPDVTGGQVLTALPTTTQARRGLFAPGRFFPMPTLYRAAAVIAIAVVALGGLAFLFGGSPGPSGPPPAPTPSATVAAYPRFRTIDCRRHTLSARRPHTDIRGAVLVSPPGRSGPCCRRLESGLVPVPPSKSERSRPRQGHRRSRHHGRPRRPLR